MYTASSCYHNTQQASWQRWGHSSVFRTHKSGVTVTIINLTDHTATFKTEKPAKSLMSCTYLKASWITLYNFYSNKIFVRYCIIKCLQNIYGTCIGYNKFCWEFVLIYLHHAKGVWITNKSKKVKLLFTIMFIIF